MGVEKKNWKKIRYFLFYSFGREKKMKRKKKQAPLRDGRYLPKETFRLNFSSNL